MPRTRPLWLRRLNSICLFGFVGLSQLSITVGELFGFLGLLVWWGGWAAGYAESSQYRFPLLKNFLLFSLANILAVLTGYYPPESAGHLKKLLEPLVFYWILNQVPHDFRDWKAVLSPGPGRWPWLKKLLSRFGGVSPMQMLMTLLVAATALSASLGIYQRLANGRLRVYGPLNNPITFSVVLMMVGVFLLAWIIKTREGRFWKIISLVVIVWALLLTLTREAWLGFLGGAMVVLVSKSRKWLLAFPLLMVMVYLGMPESIQNRFDTIFQMREGAIVNRLKLWKASFAVIRDHPVTGVGFNGFKFLKYDYPDDRELFSKYSHFHNAFIQILVDAGLIGLLTWLSIWVGFYRELFLLKMKKWQSENDSWLIPGAGASVFAFLIACLFENHFYDQEVMLVLYVIMALPFVNPHRKLQSS